MVKKAILTSALLIAAFSLPLFADQIDTYTIQFTTTAGSPVIAPTGDGTFTYDATTQKFASFNVVWDTETFGLPNATLTYPTSDPSCSTFPAASDAFVLAILTRSLTPCLEPTTYYWRALGIPDYFGGGAKFQFIVDHPEGTHFDLRVFNTTGHGSTFGSWTVTKESPVSPIPEPSSMALLLTFLMGVGLLIRRRWQRAPGVDAA